MKYLSVCSGIEAASVAWDGLGWTPAAFAEVDTGASAVLAHHFGSNMPGEPLATNGVPNLGDMTRFMEWPDYAIDLLVGGTPCQDYSVAGKRLGMAGERGSLSLTYIEIAARYRPRWLVWENVPGVLSSHGGRDFARFLGDLSGQKISVPAGGWQNAGLVPGIADAYGLAYRVLDAQFTRTRRLPRAVPQRRRRVFVVGYLGDWRRAAAVLFDAQSLRGDPPPRREAGQGTPRRAAQGVALRGREGGATAELTGPVAAALRCAGGGGDKAHALIAAPVASTLNAHFGDKQGLEDQHVNSGCPLFVAHALRGEGFDASEDGTGRGTPLVPVAFDCKGTEVQFSTDGSHPALRSMGHNNSHQNAGGHAVVAVQEPFVMMERGRSDGPNLEYRQDGTANAILTPNGGRGGLGVGAIAAPWAVRRLTPTECERLQGFPDDWTAVPNARGKPAADGNRYKQLGNSMATNCMEWIGERIALVEALA